MANGQIEIKKKGKQNETEEEEEAHEFIPEFLK
jgi:hypothetical protein